MDTAPLAGSGALVVLDGAQGLGAVPVDVSALGCDFYAASGQKWLCGPGGIGYLYANPELVPDLPAPWSGYHALEWPERALVPGASARTRGGSPRASPSRTTWSGRTRRSTCSRRLGSTEVFDRARRRRASGWREHAARRGVTVAAAGASTLVSFEVPDPEAFTAGRRGRRAS